MTTPLLSVFIPAYDAAPFIRQAIESVLDNGYRDMEVVVVDDASTDGTGDVVASIRHPAVRLVRNPVNLGVAATRRAGVALLRGRHVALLDADDVAMPGRFEKQVARLEAPGGPDIVGGAIELFGDVEGRKFFPMTDLQIRTALLFDASFANPAVAMRLAPLRTGKIEYTVEAGPACDYALWADALFAGLRFENLPEVVIRYRKHAGAMTRTSLGPMIAQSAAIRSRVARHYFPALTEAEVAAMADGLSYLLPGGERLVNAVHALSHVAALAPARADIDAALLVHMLRANVLRIIERGVRKGTLDYTMLERMSDENAFFERWRAADDGALDVQIMSLFA